MSYFFTIGCFLVLMATTATVATAQDAWQATRGQVKGGADLVADGEHAIVLTDYLQAVATPAEVTLRFKMPEGKLVIGGVSLHGPGEDKPALSVKLRRLPGNAVDITCTADGQPMATDCPTARSWNRPDPSGRAQYKWRFDRVSNIWDERDRAEIGSSYQSLTPFDDKLFVLRLIVTEHGKQIWLDDRLIGESDQGASGELTMRAELRGGATAHHVSITQPKEYEGFVAIALDDYATDGKPVAAVEPMQAEGIPLQPASGSGLDIGDSLYRYRLSFGNGPMAPYVNGRSAVVDPLSVDPARPALRVPYRDYENVYLLAWVDDDAQSVPKGVVRFYRDEAGWHAASEFSIDDEAIASGLVKKLDRKTAQGKQLYLVRVPVETDALFGLRDMKGAFLDMEICKPVKLSRSYPDPIYYNYHPAGPPSSVHVVGVTLQEAPFGYDVSPEKFGYVFESTEAPKLNVTLNNHTGNTLDATVTVRTESYDGSETKTTTHKIKAQPGDNTSQVMLESLERLGWHKMHVAVEADGHTRSHTSSLVSLPPDTRTYGHAPNETRLGSWTLWGHHAGFEKAKPDEKQPNHEFLQSLRRIGVRTIGMHSSFVNQDDARSLDFEPVGPHTLVSVFHRLDIEDPVAVEKMLADELALVKKYKGDNDTGTLLYYYGGEWGYDHHFNYLANPRYTGEGPYVFDEKAMASLKRQMFIFEKIGRMLRKEMPEVKLVLQWGAPTMTIGFMEQDFPKELVDIYGMDAPMFELTPESVNQLGNINQLWMVRQEQKRLGWPDHKIAWTEGPFLPTNPGALTERAQEQNQVRYLLMGIAYGIERFEAGVVDSDAGNYYGVEHYGQGIFHRRPNLHPKPAVAAVNTASTMLCGADFDRAIDTGVPTTFAMAYKHAQSGESRIALWRVAGDVEATLAVSGASTVTATDSMGNSTTHKVVDGKVTLTVGQSPLWLTGADDITAFDFASPVYKEAPAKHTVALGEFDAKQWKYDPSEHEAYARNHFSVSRQRDEQLAVELGQASEHGQAAVVSLPEQSVDDRPLTSRYGTLEATQPIAIPGSAKALGIWMDGNSSWGRVVYQLVDAKGERWTSIGTKDNWNCDDTMNWSYLKHEGWRYASFPLPGNFAVDGARYHETTWWKHDGGPSDGAGEVDLPLKLERIYVEARNATQVLGEMQIVPDRDYRIAGLVAEYDSPDDMKPGVVDHLNQRMPVPVWGGPTDNAIAELAAAGVGESPVIKSLEEPHHWNDGRRMIIHFDEQPDTKYQLYLSRSADGRGAEPIRGFVTDGQLFRGLRPEIEMHLFLVAKNADGQHAKPSPGVKLITEDKFAEK